VCTEQAHPRAIPDVVALQLELAFALLMVLVAELCQLDAVDRSLLRVASLERKVFMLVSCRPKWTLMVDKVAVAEFCEFSRTIKFVLAVLAMADVVVKLLPCPLSTFNAATRAVEAAVDWAARLAFREEKPEDDTADWVATSEFTDASLFAAEVD
jgi:hypothetical protein